ncbi:hypothetical protein POTOM_061966 [Populus tomentosa]|uniref:VDE lipocalin domain-containing protein n=1 Tax=Populus tomentosa TaxID=118781 RepID=A0A8X7XRM5_POPTO|nr:hypothetical protein POTOM_061966 [Populus tomentosa]
MLMLLASIHAINRPDETECQVSSVLSLEMLADTAERILSVQSHERSLYLRSLMLGNSVPDPAILVKNFNVADFVGKNDAWDGYGGAVVYTRSAVLPESIVLELEMAAKSLKRLQQIHQHR